MTKESTARRPVFMARRNNKRDGGDKASRKATFKKFAKDSARGAKIAVHNGFITFVFGFAMLLTCIIAMEMSYIIAGFAIGAATNGKTETVGDFVVIAITVAMTCVFVSFFAKKLINVLILAMKKRLWHTDEITGEIDKGEAYNKRMAREAIADGESNTNVNPANENEAGPKLAKRNKRK